jgi:uncharacterized repeat protein (TIGR02543 family)
MVTRLTSRDESGRVAISERRVVPKREQSLIPPRHCWQCSEEGSQIDRVAYLQRGHGFIVTYDPQGGVMSVVDGIDTRFVTARITNRNGRMWVEFTSAAMAREGYFFHGWWTAPEGGTWVGGNATFAGDTTVYARWVLVDVQQVHNITFDANGGALGSLTSGTFRTAADGVLGNAPATPTRNGYRFVGWFTAREGGEQLNRGIPFTEDTTFYAQWTPIRVSFNTNGGEALEPMYARDIPVLGLPIPIREGFEFTGWFPQRSSVQVTEDRRFTSDETLHAEWVSVTPGVFEVFLSVDRCSCAPNIDFHFPRILFTTDGRLTELPFPQEVAGRTFAWEWRRQDIEVTTDTVFTSNAYIAGFWEGCKCDDDYDDRYDLDDLCDSDDGDGWHEEDYREWLYWTSNYWRDSWMVPPRILARWDNGFE